MSTAADLHGDPHVRRYRETDGEDGYRWQRGTTTLLLTTTGRRSGERRTSALIFRPHGDACVVVASTGGADTPPAWFLDLQADPDVEVQVGADRYRARARVASPEEKPALWASMVEVWPDDEDYQRKTPREIPVVLLERTEDG